MPRCACGRPADVAHDRDAGLDERLDDPAPSDAALDLDGLGAGLLEEPTGVLERFVDGRVGEERHVADDQRPLRAADHGLRVVEHLGHRHADGRLVAEQHLAERIADEQQRDAGLVEELGGRDSRRR